MFYRTKIDTSIAPFTGICLHHNVMIPSEHSVAQNVSQILVCVPLDGPRRKTCQQPSGGEGRAFLPFRPWFDAVVEP